MEVMAVLSICLDTNILIDTLRGDEETVKQIQEIETSGNVLSTTTINAFELYYGAEKTENRERNKEAVRKILERLLIYDFTENASEKAGEIAANLEAEGNTIDFRDVFIGATALVNDSTIFTKDINHFERIPHLKLQV
jgi:predicted nucleic acid-binding protein